MNVAELQSFLRSLSGPLAASGGKRAADELDRAAGGLDPFRDLTIAQFADFLTRAEEYHRTGVVPAKPAATRRTVAADPVKIQVAAQRMRELYERAGGDSIDYSAIDSEVRRLDKELKKDELLQAARQFGVVGTLKTKKAAVEAVRRRIAERKESAQRTQF